MRRRDRKQWEQARTLEDLINLTVMWLEGRISEQPNYYSKCDVEEDGGLLDALIALNHAGFLTNDSNAGYAGIGYTGAYCEVLAAVIGFADDDTRAWLSRVVDGTDLQIQVNRCGDPGARFDEAEVEFEYDLCTDEAIEAVCGAWQVRIYDPEPGRNDMWELLRQAAEDRLDR